LTQVDLSSQAAQSSNVRLGFIGAGNMARSLIGGLLKQGFDAQHIIASDPSAQCLQMVRDLGAQTAENNAALVASVDVVVLAVKPQVMADVLQPLAPLISQHQVLLVSIAAGINCASLAAWSSLSASIVRCMPNTPALLQCGATGLYANAGVSSQQRDLAQSILEAVGLAIWVDSEDQLDAVTALSGSGPAYFFLLMELMQANGEQLGLSAPMARALTLQTALGAAKMALDAEVDTATLRAQVTSPNGTTEAAIKSFQSNDFSKLVEQALNAAHQRSIDLAKELG